MYIYTYIYLALHLYLYVYLSIYIYPSVYLSIPISMDKSVCTWAQTSGSGLSVYLSISIYRPI